MEERRASFAIPLEPIIRELHKLNAHRVIIQVPAGLRPKIYGIVKHLNMHKIQTIVSADPCYGACDIAYEELRCLNGDLILHMGHTSFPAELQDKVLFLEIQSKITLNDAMQDSLRYTCKFKKIGLVATIQHINDLTEVETFLKNNKKKVYIGQASNLLRYNGQILGCDFTTALKIQSKVDCFLVIAGGTFHGIGVLLATKKPTIVVDPFLGKAINVNKFAKKFIQLKKSAERRFFEAGRIGIILGLKSHQLKMNYVKNLYSRLIKIGKDPVILCAREITPDNLNDFLEFQAFINTACPRIAIDNRHLFHKPILNYDEALSILKIMEENFEEKTT